MAALLNDSDARALRVGALLPATTARSAMQPEKRLLLAMLEDAIATAIRPAVRRRRGTDPRTEARHWIASDATSWPFSFVNVCDALEIDPGYVRRGLALRDADQLVRRPLRSGARLWSGSRTRVVSRERPASSAA